MTMTKVKGTSASVLILALMMWALAANTVKAQMITSSNQVIDCGQVLFRKPVTVHFELTNQGKGNAVIKNVETSCGCMNVIYPKGMISENKPFIVTATYDAKLMGHFEKYIDIYTNEASLPFTLTMKGVVVAETKDYEGQYPYVLGKLKTDRTEIAFDDVDKGDHPVQEIHVLNSTSETVTPLVMNLPDFIKADVSPSTLAPGKPGIIYLTLNSDKLQHLGLVQNTAYLGLKRGDRMNADNAFDITTILLPNFGIVTDQQLVYMPKLKISETTLDLGTFEGKKKKKGTINIENLGRTDLEIYAIQSFTEGLTIEMNDPVIQPGMSEKLRITADKKMLKGVKAQPKVLLITNDPRSPKVIIDVNVK